VLILREKDPVTLACAGECVFISDGLPNGFRSLQSLAATDVAASAGKLKLGDAQINSDELTLTPRGSARVTVNAVQYAGSVRVSAAQSPDGQLLVVNLLDVETYLAGVVPQEMPPAWPQAALKAQAIAARTYALQRVKVRSDAQYDLEATTADQVYRGWQPPTDSLERALRETRGIVLMHHGHLFPAYYHSTCGGETLDAKLILPAPEAFFIEGVKCGFCGDSPHYSWNTRISRPELIAKLRAAGFNPGLRLGIAVKRAIKQGPVTTVIIVQQPKDIVLSADQFINVCGRERFLSRRFDIKLIGEDFRIEGKGFGHGAGMCQYGARGMALKNWTFDSILAHYYGDVELIRIY
jgi:stage II sporulation protein D